MVQWLGLSAFTAEGLGSMLGQGLRSHKPHGTAKKRKRKRNWKDPKRKRKNNKSKISERESTHTHTYTQLVNQLLRNKFTS